MLEGKKTIEGVDDGEEFRALRDAMERVGIGKEEQHSYFKIIAAILLMGNLRFVGDVQAEIRDVNLVKHICNCWLWMKGHSFRDYSIQSSRLARRVVSQSRDVSPSEGIGGGIDEGLV